MTEVGEPSGQEFELLANGFGGMFLSAAFARREVGQVQEVLRPHELRKRQSCLLSD